MEAFKTFAKRNTNMECQEDKYVKYAFQKIDGKHNLHIKFLSENKKIIDYLEEVEQYLNGS